MSVNYEFEINAREVFAALRETSRLPPAINGAQVDTTDLDTWINFALPIEDDEQRLTDLLKLAVMLP